MFQTVFEQAQKLINNRTTPNFRIALILLFGASLIIFRQFNLFQEPRFWAEEATIYFKLAYESDGFINFFTPQLGYYSFFNQIASYAALLVPLKHAPLVTTILSAIPIFLVFYLSIVTRNLFLHTFKQRLLFATLIILISTGEIWLNTITSQFWLAVCSLLILLDRRAWNHRTKVAFFIIVISSSLTGVITLFLLPLAMILFLLPSTSHQNVKFIFKVITMGLLIQVTLLLSLGFNFGTGELSQMQGGDRFNSFELMEMVKSLAGYYALYPFTGISLFEYSFDLYAVYAILLFGLFIYLVYVNYTKEVGLILSYCIFVSVLTIFLSVGGQGGLRYSFLVNSIVVMLLISFVNSKNTFQRAVVVSLLTCSMLIGVLEYRVKLSNFYNTNWVTWKEQFNNKEEVNKFIVWPQSPYVWSVELKKQDVQ